VDGLPIDELVSSESAEGVLNVTLRRPEKRNALSRPLIAALAQTFTRWRDAADIRVAVLTGEGDKAFASGGDVKELDAVRTEADTLEFAQTTRAALDTIRHFPVPVIAALNGDALGGGAELALACDMRFAAPHARIGFLQGRLNIATAWGGGTDVLRLLGPARALTLLCSTALLDAPSALKAGLIDAVAPPGESFDAAVAAFVATLSARPPQVMRAFKALAVAHRAGAGAAEMAAVENREFTQTWIHDDHWSAVKTLFNRRG
jgi:enoyl-CoA hydratase